MDFREVSSISLPHPKHDAMRGSFFNKSSNISVDVFTTFEMETGGDLKIFSDNLDADGGFLLFRLVDHRFHVFQYGKNGVAGSDQA